LNSYESSDVDLLESCLESGAAEAWEEFVSRFQQTVSLGVLRAVRKWTDPSKEIIEDLAQETFLKLCADNCRILRDFVPQSADSLAAYLRVIAINVVNDHFRSATARKRGGVAALGRSAPPEAREPTTDGHQEIVRALLLSEIESKLGQCLKGPNRQRDETVFWFYYRQGLSARAIAALPSIGLSLAGVESLVHRVTKELKETILGAEYGAE
jgi:RNA polymerase sigma-70 factor (ECF subfamily)